MFKSASSVGGFGLAAQPSSGFGASQSKPLFGGSNSAAPAFGANNSSPFGTNTNTTGGLFNKPAQPASGGLFGANNQTNNNQTNNNQSSGTSGGLFGGASNTTNTGGLFGANNNTNNTSGGLFGSNTGAKPGLFGSTNNTSGGLFGNTNNNTNTNTNTNTSGGLFGNNNATNTTNTSGGLFGNNNNNATNISGGLFGNNTNNSTNTSGGLFGNNTTSNANNTSGGLFGSKPATGGLFGGNTNTGTQSGGLFGNANNNTNTSGGLFGNNTNTSGGLFGNNTTSNAAPQLTAMTRVGDLPPDVKRELEEFDKYIETQYLIATALQADQAKHDQLIRSIPKDTNYLYTKLSSTKQALKFDTNQLAALKELNTELTDDINKMMHLIVQLLTPGTKLSLLFQLNEFFIKKIKKYHEVLGDYEALVKEAEEVIGGLERSCVDGFGGLFNTVEVIKAQYTLFMELCDTIAQLHSAIVEKQRAKK